MKRTLFAAVVMVLALSMAVSGTIAYLSDTDSDVNVMTLGNVKIEQLVYQRIVKEGAWVSAGETDKYGYTPDKMEEFTQAKPLYPAYFADGVIKWDDRIDSHQQSWKQIDAPGSNLLFDDTVKGAMDKFVFVKNTGASDAYVRTWFAFEQGSVAGDNFENIICTNGDTNHWAWKTVATDVEIGDNKYVVAYATYTGPKSNPKGILAAGDTSYPSLLQVYMMPTATNDDVKNIDGNGDGLYNILVFSQAVQTINFPNAETALNAAFGDEHPWAEAAPASPVVVDTADELNAALEAGHDVYVKSGTYTFPGSKVPAGATIICEDGVTFNDGAHLNINGATVVGATFSNPATHNTVNGIYKDCTFAGSNGLRYGYAGDTVVFENCEFSGSTYGAHFDSGKNDVIFKNCTFSGFNAMGNEITKLTMEGCTFKANGRSGYNGINLWGSTEMKNCTFIFDGSVSYEWVDARGDNTTLTFTGCVVSDGTTERALIATDVGDYGEGNTITVQ